MAPFWFLLVLPINLLLWAIASSRGRERVREQSFGDALLRITDQGVKVYWQKHWETYGQYSLSFEPGHVPDSVGIHDHGQPYWLRLGLESAPSAFMMASVVFGTYGSVGVTPAFREHAAQFGRTLPEHVAYRLSKALDAYGSYGSGGPEGPDNYQRTH